MHFLCSNLKTNESVVEKVMSGMNSGINQLNSYKRNYLEMVCNNSQNLGVIKLLVEKKIDVHNLNKDNQTPFFCLSKNTILSMETLKYFVEKGIFIESKKEEIENCFLQIFLNKNITKEMVQVFLDNKCDINTSNSNNPNCLFHATSHTNWNYDLLNFLIEKKADTNNVSHFTPLLFHAHTDFEKIKYLIENNCQPNVRDKNGNTLLHV